VLVVRFKVRAQPDRSEELAAALAAVVEASRTLPGVLHFDVARDLTDDNAFVATEVFEDRAAMEGQEALPEVANAVALLQGGAAAAAPEWTIYDVASADSPSV
jgi:quinol monooxygenase YgiN